MKKLRLLFAVLCILFLAAALSACGDGDVGMDDITYSQEGGYLYITPNTDAEYVYLEYLVYGEDGCVVKTETEVLGSVYKNKTYKIRIPYNRIELVKVDGWID